MALIITDLFLSIRLRHLLLFIMYTYKIMVPKPLYKTPQNIDKYEFFDTYNIKGLF